MYYLSHTYWIRIVIIIIIITINSARATDLTILILYVAKVAICVDLLLIVCFVIRTWTENFKKKCENTN